MKLMAAIVLVHHRVMMQCKQVLAGVVTIHPIFLIYPTPPCPRQHSYPLIYNQLPNQQYHQSSSQALLHQNVWELSHYQ